ncbi:hypothetical protein CCR91_01065 [Thiorhodovibrio winogradskyi]|nr:hypothetical protein [Thiorhodovibrio winogradskyi]
MPAADWLTSCETIAGWQRWMRDSQAPAAKLSRIIQDQGIDRLGHAQTHFLTTPNLAAFEQQLRGEDAEAFIATPTISNHCHETTPLARMADHPLVADLIQTQGNGLLTRFTALLSELAQTLTDLATTGTKAPPPVQTHRANPNTCIAAVPAARGLLVHRLVAREARIEQHQVLAPTEWNFHPQGSLAQALTSLPPSARDDDPAEIKRLAQLLITAIDPCVDYQLNVNTTR